MKGKGKYGAHLIPSNWTGERVATFRQGNAACGRDLSFYVTLIFVEFHRGRKLKRETGAGPNDWAIRRSILGGARVSHHDRASLSLFHFRFTLSIQKYKLRKFLAPWHRSDVVNAQFPVVPDE